MSLELLQGYPSDEDDGAAAAAADGSPPLYPSLTETSESDEDAPDGPAPLSSRKKSRWRRKNPNPSGESGDSSLPSAVEVFAKVTGPPDFLKNSMAPPEEVTEALGVLDRRGEKDRARDRRDLPAGAIVEAKPQLVAIRDRPRSDLNGGNAPSSTTNVNIDGKRVYSATNPGPEDVADLLRMCTQCGIPKTYSHDKGMVCPVCHDRPLSTKEPEKKKGSAIKEKEKSKRMRGQSSHATWKSETEMLMRQQFD